MTNQADAVLIAAAREHAERAARRIEAVLPLVESTPAVETLTAALDELLDAVASIANVDDAWKRSEHAERTWRAAVDAQRMRES